MQVLLHTDGHVDGSQGMAEHLESVVKEALNRFGDHVTRVDGHLVEAGNHAKSSPSDIQCTLETHLSNLPAVIVKDHAPTAHQAIAGALEKLKRAVTTAVEKHQGR